MDKHLRILLFGSFLWYFGEGLFGPLYAIFVKSIGGDILDVTLIYSAYLIATGLMTVLVGALSDRFSKEKLMVAGYALNTIGAFGYLFVSTPEQLLLVQIVLGIALALALPTWDAIFSLHNNREKAGSEWGISDGMPYIVMGVAVLCGGFIVTTFGFTTLFAAMGIIQFLATLVQARILFYK